MTTETPKAPVRWLTCCCCGGLARGRQWPNQDTGYGLCAVCAGWIERRGVPSEEMRQCYGVRGEHWDVPEEGVE